MLERGGYVSGFNRRAPALSVLVVEPRAELLSATAERYLLRMSFAVAVLPEYVLTAANVFTFDGVVVPAALENREELIARLGATFSARILDDDDPIAIARQLRATAFGRGVRSPTRRQLLRA